MVSLLTGGVVRRWKRRLIAIAVVAVVAAGVYAFVSTGASLPDDGPPVETSTEAAVSFLTKITDAGQAAAGADSLTIAVTDEEVTSFLRIGSELAELAQTEDVAGLEDLDPDAFADIPNGDRLRDALALRDRIPSLPRLAPDDFALRVAFRDPEVRFRDDGTVIVRGTARFLFLTIPARVVVAPRAEDGDLEFDFVEGQFGRLPLPERLIDLAGAGLTELILAGQDYASVDRIAVTEGTLTFSGRLAR